jgi:hypothetical protein
VIEVRRISGGNPVHFEVIVRDGTGKTHHDVTLDFENLAHADCTAEQYIKAAFCFLLDRESKEAILKRFDISLITRYFPEFPNEIRRYLPAD